MAKRQLKPKQKLDHLTEAATDILEFLDDQEVANLSGLSIEQVEKMREEGITSKK